jgi:hypothetical protein
MRSQVVKTCVLLITSLRLLDGGKCISVPGQRGNHLPHSCSGNADDWREWWWHAQKSEGCEIRRPVDVIPQAIVPATRAVLILA